MHGRVTADAFRKKMQEELKAWTDRQRLVHGVESTPAEARSPKPADRVHGTSSITRTFSPIATLESAGATPPPMAVATSVGIAGPSQDRRQVSRQEANDRLLAEKLQAALHEDDPMSFKELDRSESSTEGDDEEDDAEKKGKGKTKMPSKRKVKAGGTGVT
jgi:hypothetical protein